MPCIHYAVERNYVLGKSMNIFKRIYLEGKNIYEKDPACRSVLEACLLYPSIRAIITHQIAHKQYRKGRFTFARWLSQNARKHTGIEIHPGATIGYNIFMDHGMGIVIGETAVIGNDVTIYHGVTLGGTGNEMDAKRHPTIENGVLVGAGATVLGNITLGENAKIGAGALVLDDVPANTTAVGMPVRIIYHEK